MKRIALILISVVIVCALIGVEILPILKSNQPTLPQGIKGTLYGTRDFLGKMLELVEARVAYAKEGDPAHDLLKQGFEHARNHEYDEAISYFERILREYPESEHVKDALVGLIGSYVEKYLMIEAKSEYLKKVIHYSKKIIERFPETEEAVIAHSMIASSYSDLEDLESSVKWYEKALKEELRRGEREDIAHVIGALGLVYYRRGEPEKARDMFLELIENYSDTSWGKDLKGLYYMILGEIYAELKRYEQAIEYIKKGIEYIKPGVVKHVCIEKALGYISLAEVYDYDIGDKEKAKIWYKKIVDEHPFSEYYDDAKKRLEELNE